jgi:formylglycine-generating enzyme required for sulfatase activity
MKQNYIITVLIFFIIITGLYISSNLQFSKKANRDYISSNIGIMKYVPTGYFQRDDNNKNISIVNKGFYIMEKEVTYPQFYSITKIKISANSKSDKPVKYVTWYHAIIFCNKLSLLEGLQPVYSINNITDTDEWLKMIGGSIPISHNDKILDNVIADWKADGYRLPTEMEWEWAAMGAIDKKTGYAKEFAGSNKLNSIDDYVWYKENSESTSHIVGTKLPNELGLYDMSGNVAEWCWDWYYPFYPEGKIASDKNIGKGPSFGTARVQRGGGWRDTEPLQSISNRYGSIPFDRDHYAGFRVVKNK